MAASDRKKEIAAALHRFQSGSLFENSIHLFNILHYDTSQRLRLSAATFDEFKECYLSGIESFDERKACISDWRRVEMLFVLNDQVIQKQIQQFKSEKIADKDIRSYLFFAINLKQQNYTRTQLSQITREFNKAFPEKPVMLLFKHGLFLTLAIVDRRVNKLNKDKDVLQKVTLIKDISINSPHRAHLEILFDLDFFELYRDASFKNFVDLHTAWQKKLDTSELNKKFYRELANWYFWACQHVVFPAEAEPNAEKRNAVNLIRLITRLMFVWFLKEKGLVPSEFFNKSKLDSILLYGDKKGSTYYKAVLQNLFFATLNQEMNTPEAPEKRKFKRTGLQQDITNLYSYRSFFKNPKEALQLFASIPFLNGGLFECLDRWDKNMLIDGFWDEDGNPLKVPDFLFFKEEELVNLSTVYGDRSRKEERVRGIIHILNSYKFTITENTPIDEEVALDPELLGKVFENLLASYNPETQTTARKQTGSFYTPREIVNYMVDESLIAYLETKLLEYRQKTDLKNSETERHRINEKLRHLFSYSVASHGFAEDEVGVLIKAIDDAKILDPACGSGAFPMGILHKMVHVLSRLDPQNERWKHRQIARVKQAMAEAKKIDDFRIREKCLADLRENIASIEAAFQDNELDYGRKLYLIENCIFGVDIQPIAVQIAKLRFFISLIVEQKVAPKKENLGVRPLPNLETKFVAANTLISLDRSAQFIFPNVEIEAKERDLRQVRESHFIARTSKEKVRFREMDNRLRSELAELLLQPDFSREQTAKLAQWDPYDQNASADFFDPEWMFGVRDGFDVVIGNPPYGAELSQESKTYLKHHFEYLVERIRNSFLYFVGISYEITKKEGIVCLILPNEFLFQIYMTKARTFFVNKTQWLVAINVGEDVFKAVVPTCVVAFKKLQRDTYFIPVADLRDCTLQELPLKLDTGTFSVISNQTINSMPNAIVSFDPQTTAIVNRLTSQFPRFENFCDDIANGISTSCDEVYIVSAHFAKKENFEKQYLKPCIRGGQFSRYYCPPRTEEFVLYITDNFDPRSGKNVQRYLLENKNLLIQKSVEKKKGIRAWHVLFRSRTQNLFGAPKILFRQTGDKIVAASDNEAGYYCINSVHVALLKKEFKEQIDYFVGLLNSTLLTFYYRQISQEKGRVLAEVKPQRIKALPIPKVPLSQQLPIAKLVDRIVSAKQVNSNADTMMLEQKIDQLVYKLYNLTDEEIAIVEESTHTKGAVVKDHDQAVEVRETAFAQPRQPMQKAALRKRAKAA
ncbi:N-6 DNA methylase [bacterium]|nr:N-6 DNA methylase [bacterium]